jgi:hypothetical protein
MGFSPETVLGVDRGHSPDEIQAAYSRRLRETDPARVRDMDPRIRKAAEQCRREVELAYRMLTAPESVEDAEVARVEALAAGEADPDLPASKSYWRAILLTMVLPGAGSWYAGGRLRGLVVMALCALALVWVMHAVSSDMAAVANAGPMGKIMALQKSWGENSGLTYGAFMLALADALVAVWAHNDRIAASTDQAGALAASASASAASSSEP